MNLYPDGILEQVNSPDDFRNLDYPDLYRLADEVRKMILRTTSDTGGHLASSLGVVELTLALHRAFNTPEDKVIWDVGHQCYAHKILTGRRDAFSTLRQYGGISGFPRRNESDYDVVDSGHSGSSISYAVGLAAARKLKKEDYSVAAVIGDGSMSSGVALEALNMAGHHCVGQLTLVLNDNKMSISQNVGGLSAYLSRVRLKPAYRNIKREVEEVLTTVPGLGSAIFKLMKQAKDNLAHLLLPGALFEGFGFKYVGPIDGHDIEAVELTLREAKEVQDPVLIHVLTRKGRGYDYSERLPEKFHGISSFDMSTGKVRQETAAVPYTSQFSSSLVELGDKKPELVAITAAMKLGTGLDRFCKRFPERFFDVGIGEQFAVNLAAGLALGGYIPVVAIYSTFLQRAFDQISQEVALQRLPVVFIIDRAGLVGEDGSTHHGYFDITYMRAIPGMTVMAPRDADELASMLEFAVDLAAPVAIRFPRGASPELGLYRRTPIEMGKGELLHEGEDVALFAYGEMVSAALGTRELLREKGISAAVVNARFAKPLDTGLLKEVANGKRLVCCLEDNVIPGGFGSAVLESVGCATGPPILLRGLPDAFIHHGSTAKLLSEARLTPEAISVDIEKHLISR